MIKTIIFDIGGVLAGFDWRTFYEGQGPMRKSCSVSLQTTLKLKRKSERHWMISMAW